MAVTSSKRSVTERDTGPHASSARSCCATTTSADSVLRRLQARVHYGDAVASHGWIGKHIEETPELKLLLHIEEGWLGQDVVAVAKGRRPLPELR